MVNILSDLNTEISKMIFLMSSRKVICPLNRIRKRLSEHFIPSPVIMQVSVIWSCLRISVGTWTLKVKDWKRKKKTYQMSEKKKNPTHSTEAAIVSHAIGITFKQEIGTVIRKMYLSEYFFKMLQLHDFSNWTSGSPGTLCSTTCNDTFLDCNCRICLGVRTLYGTSFYHIASSPDVVHLNYICNTGPFSKQYLKLNIYFHLIGNI